MTQGMIILLDMGRNVSVAEEKDQKSFFEQAKECTARIIERKIMSQGKNMLGIILIGSKTTKNNMASQHEGAFKRISVHTDMLTPSWKMIRELPEQPTDTKGDWFDGLIVAADYYKNVIHGVKFANKKIVLMTNLKRTPSYDPNTIDEVLNGFKEEGFEIDVIGPDVYSTEYDKNESFQLARQFVEATDGTTATFENVMQYLLFHKKKVVKAMPWNVDLSIGPNIKIPVSAYTRLKDEPVVKSWNTAVKDPIDSKSSSTEAVIKSKKLVNTDDQSVVEDSDKIQGFHYGQKIIPLADCDKTMLYQPGDKCLSVYGFTKAKFLTWQNLNGDSLQYIFGRKGCIKAQEALRCLVECMHELNLVGIVRRVYNNNNAPKMFALMPVLDPNNSLVCLSMTAICYKEDIKRMSFPSTNLKKYRCSTEQVNAFKELIHAMDLTKAYDDTFDDTEAFPIAESVSPCAQYLLDCIAFRATNPGKPLPKPRQEIMALFEVPPLLLKNSKKPLEKIKSLFELKKVETKLKRNRKLHAEIDDLKAGIDIQVDPDSSNSINMPKVQLPVVKTEENKTIGTIDPIGDFDALKNNNKSLTQLASQMRMAVESLIYSNLDGNYSKALEAMLHLRKEYLHIDPTDYNNWIKKLKVQLVEQDKNNVLDLIVEKKVSYILKGENILSDYEDEHSHEETQQYENDTVPNSAEITMSSELQNMFDDDDD